MAVDYVVNLECEPKLGVGGGESAKGTEAILELLKARSRAGAILEMATAQGKDPADLSVTVRLLTPTGVATQQKVTYGQLIEQAKPLDDHSASCERCPANFLASPYGCYGTLNYPVPTSSEQWLFNRLQPPNHIGGHLFLQSIKDFKNRGATVDRMRAAGLFESKNALSVSHRLSFLSRVTVTSSQLIEAILGAGETLDPWHCGSVLLWVGGIEVDGVVPTEPEHAEVLPSLESVFARHTRTAFAVAPGASGTGDNPFLHVLKALYSSWVQGVPLFVNA